MHQAHRLLDRVRHRNLGRHALGTQLEDLEPVQGVEGVLIGNDGLQCHDPGTLAARVRRPMTPIDDLAPDQRAVLQLLIKQGKEYAELAALLRISPAAVRDRAVSALDALGPRDGAPLAAERRAEVTDYLLGQQSASERQATREFLEGSAAGRAWARTVAGELRPLGGDALPEIPPSARRSRRPSTRWTPARRGARRSSARRSSVARSSSSAW